jgi:putative secretion ATPase (PEP-CTERM system associated)
MYSDHFGFTDRPFQLTPDARFYFGSRTHKKAMAYLGYGLAQGEGFIVITGEVGAGKSTLAAHLMATVDRARLNAINIVSTQVDGDDMLRLAAQGMGLATDAVSKAQLLDQVARHLEDEARRGKRTLLIVDEAQNLSVTALEELRMLSNFQVGGQALLQIFLLGQPEFREKMATGSLEQLRQRVIAIHHLEPMEPSEVEPYVIHRMKLVGWDGRPLIEAAAFAEIHRLTGGVPRKVNQFAGRLLLHAAVEELDTIDAETVAEVADDFEGDSPRPAAEPQRTSVEPVRDLGLERRVAALEAQLEEQDRAMRRVLTLLVDWVENEGQAAFHDAA